MIILYLYSELVGYQIPIFDLYTQKYGAEMHVISWDKKKLKPYNPPPITNVRYYKRSEYSKSQLLVLAKTIKPDIIYISGWMDTGYLFVAYHFKRKGIKIITAFDDIWKGTFRQRFGAFIFPFTLRHFFSHAWVAGPYQFEFAKRLGFKNRNIIFDALSGNTQLFSKGIDYLSFKKDNYPKSFLYVGNFRYIKGTDILMAAFKKYREELSGNWKLICVGNGEFKKMLEGNPNVELIEFSDQETLLKLTRNAGAFILPSRQDQWGVVVHEFTSAGLPLILSRGVGSLPMFLIEGFNGISYADNSVEELARAMEIISSKSIHELLIMSENSHTLSCRISPKTAAANFMSLLKK